MQTQDDFKIELLRDDDQLLMAVSGELDMATAPKLDAALERAARTDVETIVIDLADVSFIDSSGLRCLVNASHASRENGDRLRLRNPQPFVQRVFELSRVETQLPLRRGD